MCIVERGCWLPLAGMLRASGRVTFDISIVSGRVHSRILIVDNLLMLLVL